MVQLFAQPHDSAESAAGAAKTQAMRAAMAKSTNVWNFIVGKVCGGLKMDPGFLVAGDVIPDIEVDSLWEASLFITDNILFFVSKRGTSKLIMSRAKPRILRTKQFGITCFHPMFKSNVQSFKL